MTNNDFELLQFIGELNAMAYRYEKYGIIKRSEINEEQPPSKQIIYDDKRERILDN